MPAKMREVVTMFASQAALVLANARRYRDEKRARTDLETLIDTSPVGVVVFDARTGAPVSFNREAARIMDELRPSGRPPEHLLEIMTVRRGDGREIPLERTVHGRGAERRGDGAGRGGDPQRARRAERHSP